MDIVVSPTPIQHTQLRIPMCPFNIRWDTSHSVPGWVSTV